MYPVLITISLFLVAGSSAYMSVYGLMCVFSSTKEIILCMGLGMEIGKILIVSHLYRSWPTLKAVGKTLNILVVTVLVFLTSIEAVGFLAQSHISTSRDLRTTEIALSSLNKEEELLREQIAVIDTTLSGLPPSYVSKRIKERKNAAYDQKQSRLLAIAQRRAQLATTLLLAKEHAGPIFAVAKITKVNETDAITSLILLLVLVLEPLSVGLTVATSAAWMRQKNKPKITPNKNTSSDALASLQRTHNLTVAQIADITGRKKQKTCEEWLKGRTPVPPRALRAVQVWARDMRE